MRTFCLVVVADIVQIIPQPHPHPSQLSLVFVCLMWSWTTLLCPVWPDKLEPWVLRIRAFLRRWVGSHCIGNGIVTFPSSLCARNEAVGWWTEEEGEGEVGGRTLTKYDFISHPSLPIPYGPFPPSRCQNSLFLSFPQCSPSGCIVPSICWTGAVSFMWGLFCVVFCFTMFVAFVCGKGSF